MGPFDSFSYKCVAGDQSSILSGQAFVGFLSGKPTNLGKEFADIESLQNISPEKQFSQITLQ